MKKLCILLLFIINLTLTPQNAVTLGMPLAAQSQTSCPNNVGGSGNCEDRDNVLRKILEWIGGVFKAIQQNIGIETVEEISGGGAGGNYHTPDPWLIYLALFNGNYINSAYQAPMNYGGGGGTNIQNLAIAQEQSSPETPDCAGVLGGYAFYDDCATCVGGTTGLIPCFLPPDCNGDLGGTAYRDSCDKCVGGLTGKLPCIQDCAGVWGGKSYLDSTNICVDSIRKQPCDSLYKALGDSLYSYLYKSQFSDSLNKLFAIVDTATVEYAMSLGKDSTTGAYKASYIRRSNTSANVPLITSALGLVIEKFIHLHNNSAYFCFSNGDFYALKNYMTGFNQANSQYVIAADSSVFAMVIEDSTLYSQYLAKYPYDSIKGSYRDYNEILPLGATFKNVYTALAASENLGGTLNDDDAFTQAQAFVLSKFNSGLIIYRKLRSETKFSKINTKVSANNPGGMAFLTYNCQ